MKKVMLFGTFDMLHKGHLNLFRQARKLGNYLIVVVARDKTVREVKTRPARHSEKERMYSIKESGLVEKAVLGNLKNKYAAIKKYKPNIIALGYDQKYFTDDLKDKLKELKLNKIKIVRLKSYNPKKYKTSKLLNNK